MTDDQKNSDSSFEKLWILPNWYLEVDANGYYRGYLGEGSLGVVVCLKGAVDGHIAWKLPRLLADTLQENCHIESLLALEAKVVIKVRDSDINSNDALLLPRDADSVGVFKGLRQLRSAEGQRAKQDGHALFVQFRKESPPRFCLVQFNGDELSVIPKNVTSDLKKFLTPEIWKLLSVNSEIPFAIPSYFYSRENDLDFNANSKNLAGPLKGTIESQSNKNVWFTGLASIQSDWAATSLQQNVGDRALQTWRKEQHVTIWQKILNGILTLHRLTYMHGDIRPANIFCKGDPTRPENYYLGDYGSFSAGEYAVNSGGASPAQTPLGPDMARGRASPFYSQERRSGTERETADLAIIFHDAQKEEFRIWLGWRSIALNPDGSIKEDLVQDLKQFSPAAEHISNLTADDYLRQGDRIRIRDQVFKVKMQNVAIDNSSASLSKGLICICEGWFATVLHDKLTVTSGYEIESVPEIQKVALSSFTELRQWSAATDIFSVGVLMLYTLYSSGRQKGYLPRTSKGIDVASHSIFELPQSGPQHLAVIDAEFRQLMAIMESIPYLRMIWPDLTYVVNIIKKYSDKMKAERSASIRSQLAADLFGILYPEDKENEENKSADINRTLKGVASNITQSIPNIKVVLQQFDCNLLYFIAVFHFIMQCLHRNEHLGNFSEGKDDASAVKKSLFSDTRVDRPDGSGPALKAIHEFEIVRRILDNDTFRDSAYESLDVPDFDVRSEFMVKIKNVKLEMDLVQQREELSNNKLAIANLKKDVELSKKGLDEKSGESAKYRDLLFSIIKSSENTSKKFLGSQNKLYETIAEAKKSTGV